MAEYMLSLPGIGDPEMPDGTTGFAMALARDNAKLVEILLAYYQKYPEGRAEERRRDIRIAEEAIENVAKYVWSIQSVNPAVQNVGPVGWC